MNSNVNRDLHYLRRQNVTYRTLTINTEWNDKKNKLVKKPVMKKSFKNVKINTEHNKKHNGSMIPMGYRYNLIGIDVDNEGESVENYYKLCDEIGFDGLTLTIATANDGIHQYFRLSDEQQKALEGLCSLDRQCFQDKNIEMDIKYNNQILFGPSHLLYKNKEYTYKVDILQPAVILPDFLFKEILKHYVAQPKKTAKTKKTKNTTKNKSSKSTKSCKSTNQLNEVDQRLSLYLDCISIDRLTEYDSWLSIGCLIFNEGGTVHLWDKYSAKASNYTEGVTNDKWRTFDENRNKTISFNSLIAMAKIDNPKLYLNALKNDKQGILNSIFRDGIDDENASNLFYSLFPNNYIYDKENKEMYIINKYGIYKKDVDCLTLKLNIKTYLLNCIEIEYMKLHKNMSDEDQKTIMTKKYCKARMYLRRSKTKNTIVDELKLLYAQDKIYERLDCVNKYVIGFENGVYDIENKIFRNAKPEELITCSTGYKYSKPNQQILDKLYKNLKDVMDEDEELDYILKSLSFGLIGDNPLEEFYIWIGSGANGKGFLGDLCRRTLGDYFDVMPIEYLCKTKHQGHANSADPVLARKKNTRLVITTEPEGGAQIRNGKLKELSGKDEVQVRDLYKSSFNFVPKFSVFIQSNKLFEIDGTDGGIIRRLRFQTFKNKFVDNPTRKFHKKIDRQLKNKIESDDYKIAFFHILLEKYIDFVENDNGKLKMPNRFQKETKEFIKDNDPVKEFLDMNCIITDNAKDTVRSSELFESFVSYNNGNTKTVNRRNFKSILASKGITNKKTRKGIVFQNIKLIEDDESEEELMFIDK